MKTSPASPCIFQCVILFLAIHISTISSAQFKRVEHPVYFAVNKNAVTETVSNTNDNSSLLYTEYSNATLLMGGVLTFSGQLAGKSLLLKWQMINPADMREIVIEKSIKGSRFKVIGKIKLHRNTKFENNTLEYKDENFEVGNVSYRLKLTCRHWVSQFSNVLKVETGERKDLSFPVYKDVGNNKIIINIESDVNELTKMLVIDNNGKIVKQREVSLFAGLNNFSVNEMDKLSPGSYQAIIKKKGEIYTSTFLLQ